MDSVNHIKMKNVVEAAGIKGSLVTFSFLISGETSSGGSKRELCVPDPALSPHRRARRQNSRW